VSGDKLVGNIVQVSADDLRLAACAFIQSANPLLRPKFHSTLPPGIMTPDTSIPRCCSSAGRQGTS
jgi:hypothetical protein